MAEAEKNAVTSNAGDARELAAKYPVKVTADSERVSRVDEALERAKQHAASDKIRQALAHIGAISTDNNIDAALSRLDERESHLREQRRVLQVLRKSSPATRAWLVEFIRVGRGAV